MIEYLTHSEIDKAKWNNCIENSFNGIIYAYSWYLDVLCESWDALIIGDYEYVFPLTYRKKYGIHYLCQPYFNQQLGVFSNKKLDEGIVSDFIDAIPDKFKFIEINLNKYNKISRKDFKYKTNITLELDLISSHEELKKDYSENNLRNVKTAEKNNLTINDSANPEEIINLFRKNRGKQIKNLKDNDYENLKSLIDIIQKKGKGQVWAAYKENELCAGIFFVESNNKVIFLFSGSGQTARETGAMSFIIDKFIEKNAQRNLILDFAGSNNENLARFYKGFGSKECSYLQIRKNNLPWFIKWMKR
ncbi:MAG: hypothetical protein PHD97_12280 [Bacteroidales bacterium]|nr:hypothetical protein [Bacteroidales bacterium]